jgi:bifunctional non-homologous end joining protein LigD
MIFDLLHVDGRSTLSLPYRDRRALLERLDLNGDTFVTTPSVSGSGAAVLAAASRNGLEGVVAKRLDSPYAPGRRTDAWIKIKNFATQEVVIGGWSQGKGHREGVLGALLVGIPGPNGLRFAGKVGSGFTESTLADLITRLALLVREDSPFDAPLSRADATGATYVEPSLVGEVRFSEWTRSGRLRQPSWRGLRTDKTPDEVVVEPIARPDPT